MNQETLDKLYAPFELKERVGLGGMRFKYIPSDQIVDRMNKTFGGNWSTEVQSQEVIEDSVLLRVKVRVFTDDNWYDHEGYGASSFKRFNSGPNQGKIIDVGNAYKAALSMAIRNACSRFGCGLHIEGDPEVVEDNSGGGYSPTPPAAPSFTPPSASPTPPPQAPPSAPVNPPVPGPAPAPAPEPPPQPTPPQNNVPPVPPVPPPVLEQPAPRPSPQPQAPPTPTPSAPPQQTQSTPPEPNQMFADNGDGMMSSVQEAALDALVNIKGLDYNTLASEALGVSLDQVPTKDQLKSSQATLMIKHGNDKARR